MSYSANERINIGAYERPYSGVGIEYYPLNACPDNTGVTLHECGFLPENRDWNFPSVFSPFWRLYYNFKKGHCVLFDHEMTELTPEKIMLIPDHNKFHCLGLQPVPTFWLAFSVARKLDNNISIPVLLKPGKAELSLIAELADLIKNNKDFKPTEAIYQYGRSILNIVLCRKELLWQPPIPPGLAKVEQLIRESLHEKTNIPELARSAGMSPETIYRFFRKYHQTTPSKYISELRISRACNLLLNTDMSIDQITEQTGFPTRAYFSRIFHKTTDEWPASFRKKHRISSH